MDLKTVLLAALPFLAALLSCTCGADGTDLPPDMHDAIGNADSAFPLDDHSPFVPDDPNTPPADQIGGTCEPLTPAPPAAGSPCDSEGSMRCSDTGAYVKKFWTATINPPLGKVGICVRPAYLECQRRPDGSLAWIEVSCRRMPDNCYGNSDKIAVSTCQENERGVHCCPTVCKGDKNSGSDAAGLYGDGALMCTHSAKGRQVCAPNSGVPRDISECSFLDEAAPYYGIDNFDECGEVCKDCTYWYLDHKCGTFGCCLTPSQCPIQCGPKCLTDWRTLESHCASSCSELGCGK